jgi:hypothetical protein
VIGHGAAGRGEDLPGAPLEVLAVVRILPSTARASKLHAQLAAEMPAARVQLAIVEAHQLGWLSPSIFQQSLLAGAVLLWGDPATVRVIPSWRPDQLDPRLALDEQVGAEADLAAGWPALAAQRAAGALLLARRRFEPRFDRRVAALRDAWPEAPALPAASGAQENEAFVASARRLLHDWLFTWEGAGLEAQAMQRYATMWRASRAGVAV